VTDTVLKSGEQTILGDIDTAKNSGTKHKEWIMKIAKILVFFCFLIVHMCIASCASGGGVMADSRNNSASSSESAAEEKTGAGGISEPAPIPVEDESFYSGKTKDEKYTIEINFSRCTITKYNGGPAVNLVIPDTLDGAKVTAIAGWAFGDAKLSGSVTIPQDVTVIGEYAFCQNYNITSVNIPEGVTTIGKKAFASNQLTSITIPPGVKVIEEGTFYNNRLTNVNIPPGVTSIGKTAFSRNKLAGITIPANAPKIDASAFSGSAGPAVAAMEGKNGTYIQRNGVWYLDDTAIPAFALLLPGDNVAIFPIDTRRFGDGYLLKPGKHTISVFYNSGASRSGSVALAENFEAWKTYQAGAGFVAADRVSFFINKAD
jgi:hypothetical protein